MLLCALLALGRLGQGFEAPRRFFNCAWERNSFYVPGLLRDYTGSCLPNACHLKQPKALRRKYCRKCFHSSSFPK